MLIWVFPASDKLTTCCPLYASLQQYVCISYWSLVCGLPRWEVLPPRAPPDNYLVLLPCLLPVMSSILTYTWIPYSAVTRSFCVCAPNRTLCAPISTMSPAVFLGHSLKQGRRSHSVGTLHGSVLCIHAIRVRVHSQISRPTPHSVSRCKVVSCLPQCVQLSVSTSRILCSLVFVGSKLWITIYHFDFAPSDIRVLWRLLHTHDHSISGRSCITRTSRGLFSAFATIRWVSYTRRLKALCVSSCFRSTI